jgi:hypothetical protein
MSNIQQNKTVNISLNLELFTNYYLIDPYEFNNIINDQDYQEAIDSMRILLDKWIERTGDTGQYPEKREDAMETIWFNFDKVYGKLNY